MSNSFVAKLSKDEIAAFCDRWKITEFALFGSLAGRRDRLIHNYDQVNLDRIWETSLPRRSKLFGND